MGNVVYESPDQGKTVYARESGQTQRVLVTPESELRNTLDSIREDQLWHDIRRAAKKNPQLGSMLEEVKVYYNLIR